ncbi:MAG: hypothetical protein ACOC40_03265 [Thermoplasmatota archaeon]
MGMFEKDKKIYLVIAITFILISTSLICGCLDSENDDTDYNKGIIKVDFKDNVTKEEAIEIIQSFNCTLNKWESWFATVNVPEGEEKKYVRRFENHTAVDWADLVWEDT